LRGETLTRRNIAAVLGVQVAAADRHLRVLRELPGVRDEKRGGLRLDRRAVAEAPRVPVIVAACLSNGLATLFRGTPYESGMRQALEYLVAQSPRRALFQNLDRKFAFIGKGGDVALAESRSCLDELIDGVLRSRLVRIRYTRFSGKRERLRIEPLTIAVYEHQLYVIGRSRTSGYYPYRFSRILEAEVETTRFEYPKATEHDPDELFANGMGIHLGEGAVENVVVRLDPLWRTYALHHRWHRSQVVRDLPDGGVQVSLHARVTPEVLAWVLGFGCDAEVVSPPALRAQVAKHVRRLSATYHQELAALPGAPG
jgi:predicted DNA-binding transcriptional regulator YafY